MTNFLTYRHNMLRKLSFSNIACARSHYAISVSKTVVGATPPRVRIPLPPPNFLENQDVSGVFIFSQSFDERAIRRKYAQSSGNTSGHTALGIPTTCSLPNVYSEPETGTYSGTGEVR